MGGSVSKSKLVNKETGGPITFFNLNDEDRLKWIYGGSIPVFKSTLEHLRSIGIKLIVSLTIEPLKIGRNINHIPYDHSDTEWVDGDIEEKDLEGFTIVHIPIADGYFPTPENAELLLKTITDYRKDHPDDLVYFHCWQGRGRTCTAIAYILTKMFDIEPADTIMMLRGHVNWTHNKGQINFVLNMSECPLTAKEIEMSQRLKPTPSDHECWTKDLPKSKDENKNEEIKDENNNNEENNVTFHISDDSDEENFHLMDETIADEQRKRSLANNVPECCQRKPSMEENIDSNKDDKVEQLTNKDDKVEELTKEKLFEYTYELHKKVNESIQTPTINYEDACKLYEPKQ